MHGTWLSRLIDRRVTGKEKPPIRQTHSAADRVRECYTDEPIFGSVVAERGAP